ncbi:unnamed protein product [Cercospora beticola]|nr:unnamed protein product [Cercospora beticola]
MAPLTRYRWGDDWEATETKDMIKEYYEQRSCVSGTLIISEATIVAKNAVGRRNCPGIWSKNQIESWKAITTAVHDKGCVIFCQLWHQGRAAAPRILRSEGYEMLSSSTVPMSPRSETPKAMTEDDISSVIQDYASAARNAIAAGFDGVEIHGANGYLPDQFLQTTCNKRTDSWGGSIPNRARFHLEVTKAVIEAIGADRTALRLSPYSSFGGMLMNDPEPTFEYLLQNLKSLKLAYLHLIEARIKGNDDSDCGGQKSVDWMVKAWDNATPILLNGGFNAETAKEAVNVKYKEQDVVIVFGRYFVSNPDLVYRIREGVKFEPYERKVFYTPKKKEGYVDYGFSREYLQASAGA